MPLLTAGPSRFLGGGGVAWLLRDEFTTDLAAGAVNGTAAEPGPGTRTVISDAANKISIAGGANTWAASGVGPVCLDSLARVAGRMAFFSTSNGSINGVGTTDAAGAKKIAWRPGAIQGASYGVDIGTASDYPQRVALCLRATGNHILIKLSGNWFLVWVDHSAGHSPNPFRPAVISWFGSASAFTVDYIRVPDVLWLPTPLVSDGFATAFGTSDGLGHAEGIATGIGAGGGGVAWTGATWSVSGGKAINTPVTLGANEISNGDMETGSPPTGWTVGSTATVSQAADERTGGSGTYSLEVARNGAANQFAKQVITSPAGVWVIARGWQKKVTADSRIRIRSSADATLSVTSASTSTSWVPFAISVRTTTTNCYVGLFCETDTGTNSARYDDVSVQSLNISELISSVVLSTANVVAGVALTFTLGLQCGLCLNLDSASAPANFVLAYHDGVSAYLFKCVAGVYTSLVSAAAAYSAGARLVVTKDGTAYRVYYNNALVGTEQTIADAGIVSNTLHGLFSTDAGNTLDDFVVYARGNEGQYASLDRYSGS